MFKLKNDKKKAEKQKLYLEKKVKQLMEELSKMSNKETGDSKEQLKEL